MQLITDEIKGYLSNSSMIRKMFEAGIELRKQYGADNVYDFSLGNPDLPPPPAVKRALEGIAARADQPFALGYMPVSGANLPSGSTRKPASLAGRNRAPIPNFSPPGPPRFSTRRPGLKFPSRSRMPKRIRSLTTASATCRVPKSSAAVSRRSEKRSARWSSVSSNAPGRRWISSEPPTRRPR